MNSGWFDTEEDLSRNLGTNLRMGLTDAEALLAHTRFGDNLISQEKDVGPLTILLRQFTEPMVYVLAAATLTSFILGHALDAIVILCILLINASIGAFQELKAQRSIHALRTLSVPEARVIREGVVRRVSSSTVVPGDLLVVEAGDYITADARLTEAFGLGADEAPLTGESLPVEKSRQRVPPETPLADRCNMLHAGTAVVTGSGRAIVTATGMHSEIGQIAGLLNATTVKPTPLQERLAVVGQRLLYLGLMVIAIVIVLYYLRGESWGVILMSAIGLAVAAIPEGLPTVVTLALTLAVRRLTLRNAIVRNLASVETLGATDIICSDKTGTLTTGVMQVRDSFVLNPDLRREFLEAMVLCNNASLEHGGAGDPTERALMEYAAGEGVVVSDLISRCPRIHEWSFDSDRKRMSVAVRLGEELMLVTKGAPEAMVERCDLVPYEAERILAEVERLSASGKRLLAVGTRPGAIIAPADEVERGLHFLGLVALADPPKADTVAAIQACRSAGIKVVMITGDHPVTARAIARELGIIVPELLDEVLTGPELAALSSEELRQRVERTAVYARVAPAQKLRIVEALQESGHVVAMTGDGVNDAPALKQAQIGVAMGKAGTEVARQAASMVLTDDNFSTIVSGVEEGRAIYGNIKRTIQYLLSTNLAEILIVLGASVLGLPIPFTPLNLLWINLVTDGVPALALAAEPLDHGLLREGQRPSPRSFFDRPFLWELVLVALLIMVLVLLTYNAVLGTRPVAVARTFAFTLLVYATLLRSFSCRSEMRSYFELPLNFYHLGSVLVPIVLQLVLLELVFFRGIFQLAPLTWHEHLFLALIGAIPVTVVELIKIWRRI